MPPMFIPGDIIFAPWRAEDGSEKHRPTVVLAWSPAYGLVALWTGTAKERLFGGTFAFSTQEREQAGFSGPCRFDPNRIVRFLPQQLEDGTVRRDAVTLMRGRASRHCSHEEDDSPSCAQQEGFLFGPQVLGTGRLLTQRTRACSSEEMWSSRHAAGMMDMSCDHTGW